MPDKEITGSAVNELLLANARKSYVELAELTGLSAEQCAEKLSALLEDRGKLTERQNERLLLIELENLVTEAQGQLKLTVGNPKEYSAVLKEILHGMKMNFDRADNRRKVVDDDINRITLAQARLWAMAIELAQNKAKFDLQKMYPEVEGEIIDAIFYDSLDLAVKELESNANR